MTEPEASATAFMLIEEVTGLTRTQILTADNTPTPLQNRITTLAQQIANGTPIQYALGYAYFCGMKFRVNPHVLIPRPETEELVEWVYSSYHTPAKPHNLTTAKPHNRTTTQPYTLLDIGTGSGCIAISLAKKLPQAQVTALDISLEALQTAKQNAQDLHANVEFLQLDILTEMPSLDRTTAQPHNRTTVPLYDCIISNPPYICESEAAQMESNVLDHEPHLALFVPDATPLLFYETIARKALHLLTPGGYLFFEINRQYGSAITTLLKDLGYTHILLRQDQFGNDRMIRAEKRNTPTTKCLNSNQS